MLRSLALALEHGLGEPDARAARSTRRSTSRSRATPTPDLGGTATTAEFGDAVLARSPAACRPRGRSDVSPIVGYPGPRRQPQRRGVAPLAPDGVTSEPLASFIAVVEAAVAAEVSLGVLPIENSLHGPVAETHDLLYEAPLSIVSEVTLPIVHCLLARAPIQVSEVKTLRSNPVAFDQCRDLVHALGARCIPTATTADAAREVAESDDPTRGGDRERRGGGGFGLHVIATDVGDHAAFTRFVGIAPYTRRRPRARAGGRRSRSSPTTQPGSLYHALGPFHRHGLNLVQLVSRPIPQSTFRYRFDMVLDGHPLDARAADGARRDARVDARGADLRQLPGDRRPLMAADAVRADLGARTSSTSGRASRR